MKLMKLTVALGIVMVAAPGMAQMESFTTGPVFRHFGPKAAVRTDTPIPKGTIFKVTFDVAKIAEKSKLNRNFESAARFINMHVAAGVPEKNIKIAVVVHGKASFDLTKQEVFSAKFDGRINDSAGAISGMQERGVQFILCGQSAAAHGIKNEDLLPGVKMELSAMTAHALLQQDGYTLNPF